MVLGLKLLLLPDDFDFSSSHYNILSFLKQDGSEDGSQAIIFDTEEFHKQLRPKAKIPACVMLLFQRKPMFLLMLPI